MSRWLAGKRPWYGSWLRTCSENRRTNPSRKVIHKCAQSSRYATHYVYMSCNLCIYEIRMMYTCVTNYVYMCHELCIHVSRSVYAWVAQCVAHPRGFRFRFRFRRQLRVSSFRARVVLVVKTDMYRNQTHESIHYMHTPMISWVQRTLSWSTLSLWGGYD